MMQARSLDGGLTWQVGPAPCRTPGNRALSAATPGRAPTACPCSARRGSPHAPTIWSRAATSARSSSPLPSPTAKRAASSATARPFGIRARLSADQGVTWSEEIILRDDGGSHDLGYPRTVLRPDGTVVTVYYYNDRLGGEAYIAATLWKP